MHARELLLRLEKCEKGEPIQLPLFIQPDFYYSMQPENADYYLNRIRERIEELNPPCIEVSHWDQLAQVHYLDFEDGFFNGMEFLFSLPVRHLHFTFEYMVSKQILDRVMHFLPSVCVEHTNKKKPLPVFTYHSRDSKGQELCQPVFSQIMQTAGYADEDVADAKAGLYLAKGEMEKAFRVYQQALQESSKPARVFLKRGLRLKKLGYLEEAREDFLKVIFLENANPNKNQDRLDSAYYHAAVAYWKLEKNIEKSLSFFSRISKTYQFHDDVEKKKSELATRLLKQGLELYRTREIAEALRTFNLGLRYLPNSSRLRLARAELYRNYHALPVIQKIAKVETIEDVLNLAIADFDMVLGSGKNSKAKAGLKACEKALEVLQEKQAEAAMDAAERRRERKPKSSRYQDALFTPASLPKDDSALSDVQANKPALYGSRI